jgi:hypothetical protein
MRSPATIAFILQLAALLACSDDGAGTTSNGGGSSAVGAPSSSSGSGAGPAGGGDGGSPSGQGGAGATASSSGPGGMAPGHEGVLLHPGAIAAGDDIVFAATADSREVVYSLQSTAGGELFAVGVDGNDHRSLPEAVDGDVERFQVSPHGPVVVYGSDRGGVALDLTSGQHTVLDFDVASSTDEAPCEFLADEAHVVCRTNSTWSLVPLDGSASSSVGDAPELAPSGQFVSWGSSGTLEIMDVAAGASVQVGDSVSRHAWKGDSSGVVFSQSTRAAEPGIWVVNNDGTDLTKLTDHVPTAMLVSPDGDWVAYKTSNDDSTVYAMYSLETSGMGTPIPYDVSGFDHGHPTTGLSLEAITPDSGQLLYAFGAVSEQFHMNLYAGALDGSGDHQSLSSITGFPTLRTATLEGMTFDWAVYSHGSEAGFDGASGSTLQARHPGRTAGISLLPSSSFDPLSLREVAVGPLSVVASARNDDGQRLYWTDLEAAGEPQELAGLLRVEEFALTPDGDHLIFLEESVDEGSSSLYALRLR